MAIMAFTVTINGVESTSEVDVSFDAARFSLKEMVRIEDALGIERAGQFINGELAFTPKALQAVLWAKLATQFPDIGLDDFDLPGEAFSELGASDDEGDVIPIPMETDTETISSSVKLG